MYEALCALGQKRPAKVTFPDYEHPSSTLVKQYLAGEFGQKPEDVNAYAASCFYSVDRFASYKTQWGAFYEAGGIVVADRYTTSNAVHQCAKLPKERWDEYLAWLFDFEYKKNCHPRAGYGNIFRCGARSFAKADDGPLPRGRSKEGHS